MTQQRWQREPACRILLRTRWHKLYLMNEGDALLWRRRMLTKLRKIAVAAAMAGLVGTATVAVPDTAHARWGGGWHGGGWHGGGWHGGGWRGGGGWGWGGFGVGLGTGLLLGVATVPYWGGYGYGGYGPYYAGYGAPYAGGCYITRRWVWNGYGHRVLRRVRVCY
jgi:hypothetical protein